MPRSISQLKHRTIHLPGLPAERIVEAIQLLETLPGVSAWQVPASGCLTVQYWVDEYLLSDLELALAGHGFPLDTCTAAEHWRHGILQEEEREREGCGVPRQHACRASGVFAHHRRPRKDDLETLPLLQ